MSTRRKFANGAAVLASGKMIVQASGLVRTVIVASIIGTANMGIAATFILTIGFLEAISAVSGDKLLIQDREGDTERMQGSVQAVQAIRAVLISIAIFLAADPVARLFGAPQAVDMYRLLALVPLIRGIQHLDQKRRQREMRYLHDTIVTTVPAVLMLIAAYPVSVWLGDYRAVMALLLFGACAQTLGSHLMAERRFAFAWDRDHVYRVFMFGWPLTVNGLLLFVILQGDSFLIGSGQRLFGSAYTHDDLGIYAIAVTLAMAPTGAVASISTALMLSLLSRAQDNAPMFERRYRLCIAGLTVASSAIAPLLIVAGPALVRITPRFGDQYAPIVQVLGILAAMQAFKMIRVAPTLAAMSRGDTKTLMATNLIRVASFAGALAAVMNSAPLAWIALSALAGEVMALAYAFIRLRRVHAVPLGASLPSVSLTTSVMLVAGAVFLLLAHSSDFVIILAGVALSGAAAAGNALALKPTRDELRSVLRRVQGQMPVRTVA